MNSKIFWYFSFQTNEVKEMSQLKLIFVLESIMENGLKHALIIQIAC